MAKRGPVPKNKLPTSPVAGSAAPYSMADHEKRQHEYKVRDALETIERAHGHMKDKELMKHVSKMAKTKIEGLSKITGKNKDMDDD